MYICLGNKDKMKLQYFDAPGSRRSKMGQGKSCLRRRHCDVNMHKAAFVSGKDLVFFTGLYISLVNVLM